MFFAQKHYSVKGPRVVQGPGDTSGEPVEPSGFILVLSRGAPHPALLSSVLAGRLDPDSMLSPSDPCEVVLTPACTPCALDVAPISWSHPQTRFASRWLAACWKWHTRVWVHCGVCPVAGSPAVLCPQGQPGCCAELPVGAASKGGFSATDGARFQVMST